VTRTGIRCLLRITHNKPVRLHNLQNVLGHLVDVGPPCTQGSTSVVDSGNLVTRKVGEKRARPEQRNEPLSGRGSVANPRPH